MSGDRFLALVVEEMKPLRDVGQTDLRMVPSAHRRVHARDDGLAPNSSVQQGLRSQGLHDLHDGVEGDILEVTASRLPEVLWSNPQGDALPLIGGQLCAALGWHLHTEPRGLRIEPGAGFCDRRIDEVPGRGADEASHELVSRTRVDLHGLAYLLDRPIPPDPQPVAEGHRLALAIGDL